MPKRLAVLGQPDRPLALARDADRRARRARASPTSGPTRRSRSRRSDFDERVRAMPGEGFVGRQRHRSAQARGARARRRGLRGRARDRRRQHAELRRRRGSPPRTPTRPGSSTRCPSPRPAARALVLGAGGSARAVVWALVDAGAEVAIWNRTPEQGRAAWRAELGVASARRDRRRWLDLRPARERDDGGHGRASAPGVCTDLKSLPIDADALGERHQLVDLAYGSAERSWSARQERGGAASSTGSRCWFTRGPPRFGSGPGWNPRSR